MKAITTAPVWKADSSLDAVLNPVALSSGEIVSWAAAFPRPGSGTRGSSAESESFSAGSTPLPLPTV